MNRYRVDVFCPWEGERDGKIYEFCRFQEIEVTSLAPPNIFSCLCDIMSELLKQKPGGDSQ